MQSVNVIERVICQAMDTFYGASGDFEVQLDELKSALGELVASDFRLDARLLHNDVYQLNAVDDASPSSETAAGPSSETAAGPSSATPARRRQTPVTFIDVYKNNWMSASVYVLRDKARTPLHDHPNMHGLLKVLVGQVRVQGYNIKRPNYNRRNRFKPIDAEKLAPVVIGSGDLPHLLRPDHGNIHQVETVDGPAAVFDMLVPPYDTFTEEMDRRVCRFFKEINTREGCKLIVDSHHKGYWMDCAPYDGPIVDPFAD